MMKQKQLKSSALSSEDISNLAIFKSVISEAGALRNHLTKLKVNQLKFSTVTSASESKKNPENSRRQILESLVDAKIGTVPKEFPSRRMEEIPRVKD